MRRQFVPNYKLADEVAVLLSNINVGTSVGVHIRRGDFVRLGWDKGVDYYKRGMNEMRTLFETPHFYIVTDEAEWARMQFAEERDVTVVDVNTETKDIDEFFFYLHVTIRLYLKVHLVGGLHI